MINFITVTHSNTVSLISELMETSESFAIAVVEASVQSYCCHSKNPWRDGASWYSDWLLSKTIVFVLNENSSI